MKLKQQLEDVSSEVLRGIYMRPGQTQTGMGSYWPPYISFTAFTMNSDQSDLVSVAGPSRKILVPVRVYTGLM